MPSVQWIEEHLKAVASQGMALSPIVRLLLVILIVFCVLRRKIYSEYIAAYTGLILLAASMLAVSSMDYPDPVTLGILFVLALLWGREALILPAHPKPSAARIAVAAAFGLAASFYPDFADGPLGPVLFAPLAIIPCPTLIAAQAAVMATRRSYDLVTVIPTWVVGLFYGLMGVFYLDVRFDWVLVAAVPVSIGLYFLSSKEKPRKVSKKLKKHH